MNSSANNSAGANPHCFAIAVKHPYYHVSLSIASTTHRDRHGEAMAENVLEDMEKTINESYLPLNYNHDTEIEPIGVLAAAKTFRLADGHLALATLNVYYDTLPAKINLRVGEQNTSVKELEKYFDLELLSTEHTSRMQNYSEPELNLEEKLAYFFDSRFIDKDGSIKVNKRYVTKIKDFVIAVYPMDHNPPHFHVKSKSRKIDARFHLQTLELLSTKRGKIKQSEVKVIQHSLKHNTQELNNLRETANSLRVGKSN